MTYDPTDYHFYWSGPLSQWQKGNFVMDGIKFVTAEQAMMYHKALLFDDHEIAQKILSTSDAGKKKAFGRRVQNFDDATWNQYKVEIVKRANYAKYRQNKGLRRKLFQTGSKALVEASPLDTVWGIGLDTAAAMQTPPENWPGQNLLGRIVTEVRETLCKEFSEEWAQIGAI